MPQLYSKCRKREKNCVEPQKRHEDRTWRNSLSLVLHLRRTARMAQIVSHTKWKRHQVKKTVLSLKEKHCYAAWITAEAVTMKWPLVFPDCSPAAPKESPFLFPCDWLVLLSRISGSRHVSSGWAQRTVKPHGELKFGSDCVSKFLYVKREKPRLFLCRRIHNSDPKY